MANVEATEKKYTDLSMGKKYVDEASDDPKVYIYLPFTNIYTANN